MERVMSVSMQEFEQGRSPLDNDGDGCGWIYWICQTRSC